MSKDNIQERIEPQRRFRYQKTMKERQDKYCHRHRESTTEYECPYCKKMFPRWYVNKGGNYYGNRGRYNFAGAFSNFKRHMDKCKIAILSRTGG